MYAPLSSLLLLDGRNEIEFVRIAKIVIFFFPSRHVKMIIILMVLVLSPLTWHFISTTANKTILNTYSTQHPLSSWTITWNCNDHRFIITMLMYCTWNCHVLARTPLSSTTRANETIYTEPHHGMFIIITIAILSTTLSHSHFNPNCEKNSI